MLKLQRDVYGRIPVEQIQRALVHIKHEYRVKEGDVLDLALAAMHKINAAFPAHHKNRSLAEEPILEFIKECAGAVEING